MRTTTLTWTVLATALVAAAALAAGAGRAQDERRQLQDVRARIKALEARIAAETGERDQASKALEALELEIAAAERKLEALAAESEAEQGRERSAAARTRTARARLAEERDALARQVRVAYMNGREETVKLLLSQQTPASFGRMVVYYGYFNRARAARVRGVATELDSLARLEAESRQAQEKLAALRQAQAAQVAELDRARDDRKALLGKLNRSISEAGGEVEQLKQRERRLAELLTELGKVMARFPPDSEEPFRSAKGRLAWPVQGRLEGDYGQPIAGGSLRRRGVLFSSPAGTPVRAIYHGRVAFADWLPGLGLLIVIDHGDGYMSLYGHNDALLKEPGDWVTPGEPIAQVGDTGGQAQPSLYFEIRHDGKPVDPHAWIRR